MGLPNRLPENGPLRKLYGWLNELRDYVYSLRPSVSVGNETQHNKTGVIRRATRIGGDSDSDDSANIPRWG